MKLFIFNSLEKLRLWTLKWADSKHSALALFTLAFAESSFFPIPPDVLLIGILAINPKKMVVLRGSVYRRLCFGRHVRIPHRLGILRSDRTKIVDIYNLQATVDAIGLKYSANAFLTVFTAAFTPIPYKLITITAGLFQISFLQLIIASVIGRGARFFIIAFVLKLFGHKLNGLVIKYFNILSLAAIILVVLSFVAIKFFLVALRGCDKMKAQVKNGKKLFLDILPPPDYLRMPALCLDLSDKSLKYMELRRKNGALFVRQFGICGLEKGIIEGGEIKQKRQTHKLFKANQRKTENRTRHSLSPRGKSFLSRINFPPMDESE